MGVLRYEVWFEPNTKVLLNAGPVDGVVVVLLLLVVVDCTKDEELVGVLRYEVWFEPNKKVLLNAAPVDGVVVVLLLLLLVVDCTKDEELVGVVSNSKVPAEKELIVVDGTILVDGSRNCDPEFVS